MSTRGTVLGALRQWSERHEFAPDTPESMLAAYRAEVLSEAADKVGSRCEEYGVLGVGDLLRRMAATAPTSPVPDNTTGDEGTVASTTVACTCLGGPTMRDGQVLHSGYCDTVVHAPWTPQREAAIRATAKEGAGSLHSALGATVPNEDVLAVFLQLDEARKELARRTPTGDEGELARCTCARSWGLHSQGCPKYTPGHGLASPAAELERLRIFAEATNRRHQEIRDHLAQVEIADSPEAWDLGMAVLALLEGPLPRNTEGGER
jgi:hypothetical protein